MATVAKTDQLGTPESRIRPAAVQKSRAIEMADRKFRTATSGEIKTKTPKVEQTRTMKALISIRFLAWKKFTPFAFNLLAQKKVQCGTDGGHCGKLSNFFEGGSYGGSEKIRCELELKP